jgi:hypothetical protein
VRQRNSLRRYFYAGEMARPPRLIGNIPRVTADWQWSGSWPVTTDALMTGAWRLPKENKLVLLLVNVSDETIRADLDFDAARYDLPPGSLSLARMDQDKSGKSEAVPRAFQKSVSAGPRQAWAWEIAAP